MKYFHWIFIFKKQKQLLYFPFYHIWKKKGYVECKNCLFTV
jgi:hypothetical protein